MIVYEEDNDLCAEINHNYFVIGDDLEYKGFRRVGTYQGRNPSMYNENILWLIKEVKRTL